MVIWWLSDNRFHSPIWTISCDVAEWWWHNWFYPLGCGLLGITMSVMSVMVVWSECLFFVKSPVLSVFGVFVNLAKTSYSYHAIEVCSKNQLCASIEWVHPKSWFSGRNPDSFFHTFSSCRCSISASLLASRGNIREANITYYLPNLSTFQTWLSQPALCVSFL